VIPPKDEGRPATAAPARHPEQQSAGHSTRPRRCSCSHHCSICGRHFTSLQAFDAHRIGAWDDRQCEVPAERFEPAIGVCRIRGPETGATIWRLAGASQRARAYFGEDESQAAEAVAA